MLVCAVKTRSGCKGQKEISPVSVSTQLRPYDLRSGLNKLVTSPVGLGKQLRPIYGTKHCNRKQSASIICAAAMVILFIYAALPFFLGPIEVVLFLRASLLYFEHI